MNHGEHEHVLNILFHPPLVHFPIAFYSLELLLLVLWLIKKDPAYLRFARFSFGLAYVLMLAAMAAGWIDAGGWDEIQGLVRRHFIGAVSLFTISTFRAAHWKWGRPTRPAYPWIQIGGALLGNLILIYTAWLGGELVFG